MFGIFSTPANDNNNMSQESIEVGPDSVLPLHAQDALRLYGSSHSSDNNNNNNNGDQNGAYPLVSMHRSSSSTSVNHAADRHSFGHHSSSGEFGPMQEQEEDHIVIRQDIIVHDNNIHDTSQGPDDMMIINNSNSDNNNESHHSLQHPEEAAADMQANSKAAAAAAYPSVSSSKEEDVFEAEGDVDKHLSMMEPPPRRFNRKRSIIACLCLVLVVVAVVVGVTVGTSNRNGGDIESNKVVIDPDNPNARPPTPAPTDGDDDFPYIPNDDAIVLSDPLDMTNYCPQSMAHSGEIIADFNETKILYGTIRNTTAIGMSNNPNATSSMGEGLTSVHDLPSCQDNTVFGRGIWYTLRGPGAVVTAKTCENLGLMWDDAENPYLGGFPLDTQLTVFTSQTSTCSDGLICVTANDDSVCGKQSAVSWYAEEGRLYYMYVSAKPSSIMEEQDNNMPFTMPPTEEMEPFPTGVFPLTLSLAPVGTCMAGIDYEKEASAFSTFLIDPSRQMQVPHTSSVVNGVLMRGRDVMDPCEKGTGFGLIRGGEVWYRFAGAETTGTWMMASTCQGSQSSNEFPARLAVYEGNCDQLQCAAPKASEVAPSVDRDCGFGYNLNWWAEPGVDYYLMVYKTDFLPGDKFALTVEALDPPTNDNCTGSILLTPDGDVTYGSTLRATYTPEELGPTCFSGVNSATNVTHSHPGVWYEVLGTGTRLTASLCNEFTKFDTKISVYEGGCGSLQCVSGNNQWCGYQSSVNWESQLGATYYILVHGSTGGTSPSLGDFGLAVFEFQPSVNDFCTDAILVEPGSEVSGSTSTASADSEFPSCDHTNVGSTNIAPGVWYKVVGTNSGMRASTCGPEATFNTRISIFKGESCEELKCIIADDNGCGFQSAGYWYANQNETYYILVTGNLFSNFGGFVLSIEEYSANTINDFCVNAIAASTTTVNLGSTKSATFDSVATCVVPNTAPGIWYKVVGTGTAMIASTCHAFTDFDTRVTILRGSDCEALECVAGNDDSHESEECGSSAGSRVTWLSQVGVEYHILVHGWGALTGTFGLNIEEVVPQVANDFCISSTNVQVSSGANANATSPNLQQITFGSTFDATIDNVPMCGDVQSFGEGVWYRSVGTGNRIAASTCNQGSDNFGTTSTSPSVIVTDFDTQISVFRGGCRALECIGANNDRCGLQSSVNFFVEQGDFFYVLVHGTPDSKGSFGLTLEEIFPQVENDFCDTATPFAIAAGGAFNTEFGSTEEASYDTVEECVVPNTSPGVWYTVIGTGRTVTVTTCGVQSAGFDTRLSVYTGSCQALECVTGNDDTSRESGGSSCGLQSTATWLSIEGQTYFIRVHGWGSFTGRFQLTISETIA